MIDFLKLTAALTLSGLVVLGVFFGVNHTGQIGAVQRNGTSTITNPFVFTQGLTLTGDGSTGSKTFTVTTSNSATSTATVGCLQTYATSTATAIRLVLGSIATSSGSYDGVNTVGLVGWRYGTCPNL